MGNLSIEEVIEAQRSFFATGKTKELSFRIAALKKLEQGIEQREERFLKALYDDLHKSAFEAYATEVGLVKSELKQHIRNVRKWARPEKKQTPLIFFPSKSRIITEPFGRVLIIAPWNYPLQLMLVPLIGAISAGNCAVLKPSPYAPSVSAVLAELIEAVFDKEYIALFEGHRDMNRVLLAQPFDYIFFTGSVSLGKEVMAAAAKNLTPLTLELGGKSPCIVDANADIPIAARRIVWGKFLNAGQTCVAPDYLFVHVSVKKCLLEYIKKEIYRQFGKHPEKSPDYPRIVRVEAVKRLAAMLDDGKIYTGGQVNEAERYIAPTVITDVKNSSGLLEDEIFGPILPVLEFEHIREVEEYVNRHPKPLALYYFTRSRRRARRLLKNISSGGACINDTVIHVASGRLPFGGVGHSGFGKYHGKYSYMVFSNMRGVVYSPTVIDIPFKYAPYKNKLGFLKRFF